MIESNSNVVVLGRHWQRPTESSFFLRSVAAALAQHATVQVLTPGRPAKVPVGDGAFDRYCIGANGSTWPDIGEISWPDGLEPSIALVLDGDTHAIAIARSFAPSSRIVGVSAGCQADGATMESAFSDDTYIPSLTNRDRSMAPDAILTTTASARGDFLANNTDFDPSAVYVVGGLVPINPLARNNVLIGIQRDDYILVLTDRVAPWVGEDTDKRTENDLAVDCLGHLTQWIVARFPGRPVVVAENGRATVWERRGFVRDAPLITRTDLWRLLARARVTVDLRPGNVLARECIESLRFGTPIVVHEGGPGGEHARYGGFGYSNLPELLEGVARLDDQSIGINIGEEGRQYADSRFGDPDAFVGRVIKATSLLQES